MSRRSVEICGGYETAPFNDDTVRIDARTVYRKREVGRYVCGNCKRTGLVSSELMDNPTQDNGFHEALNHAGFCMKAIMVAPFNEGETKARVSDAVIQ